VPLSEGDMRRCSLTNLRLLECM